LRVCRISLRNRNELESVLREVGANIGSLPFFEDKREILHLSVAAVPCAAANVLKQEMLSVGGDAIVHERAVNCAVDSSRVILLGSKKQLKQLTAKLKQMPWWNFSELSEEILACIEERKAIKTQIMGIINLTEDSFFAGSRTSVEQVVSRAEQLLDEGADILDIGAESTRPGAERIDESVELERIFAAVTAICMALPNARISVDTTRSSVARAALENGAEIINDISAFLFDEDIVSVCAAYGAKYVLMHMRGTPETMDKECDYDNILLDINNFFEEKIALAEMHGLKRENIILDPGFGFAKTAQQNRFMLNNLSAFKGFGLPLLVGVSRKRFLGEAVAPEERLEATLSVTTLCALQNVEYVRVHDVAANRRVIDFCGSLK